MVEEEGGWVWVAWLPRAHPVTAGSLRAQVLVYCFVQLVPLLASVSVVVSASAKPPDPTHPERLPVTSGC